MSFCLCINIFQYTILASKDFYFSYVAIISPNKINSPYCLPGMLKPMGSQRVEHDWATEQQQLYAVKV